jgi:hypothetical protein
MPEAENAQLWKNILHERCAEVLQPSGRRCQGRHQDVRWSGLARAIAYWSLVRTPSTLSFPEYKHQTRLLILGQAAPPSNCPYPFWG